ncbi:MAG TPA: hypothetical protein P5571_04590 [Candidatus Krumholzibacteria bacterium]|nr:hypothetical protein [Candidatus Krumholzibacteria bacterium]HRX50619.1 hypothetical protein [Candidatus Krumholzibacteria bacterium]
MRSILLALLALTLVGTPARAYVQSFYVPLSATVGEPVEMSVTYIIENQCWSIDTQMHAFLWPDLNWILVSRRGDYPLSYPCPGPLESYVFTQEFTFPSAGVWNVKIVDRRTWSLPFPAPEDQITTVPIVVGEQVPVEEATWGRVKSMYR